MNSRVVPTAAATSLAGKAQADPSAAGALAPVERVGPGPAKWLGTVVSLVMGAALLYGIASGGLLEDGASMLALPWGRVTLVETYAGFALFSGWIWSREQSRLTAGLWLLGFWLLGNLVAGCYVVLAARASRGDARRFWLGTLENIR